jgi:predicted DNA-binding protein (MmcQ/YjbR family)
MDFSFLLSRYRFDPKTLEAKGFVNKEGVYSLQKSFADPNFYAIIRIGKDLFEIKVYETSFNEEYIPFTLKTTQSPLVAGMKEQVNDWVNELVTEANQGNEAQKKAMAYCRERLGPYEDHPFNEGAHPSTTVFRTSKGGKWYALFMEIKPEHLGFPGEEPLAIVNLKENPKKIPEVVDQKHVLPAYHMNKHYWIMMILDETLPEELMEELLTDSYNEVKAKK